MGFKDFLKRLDNHARESNDYAYRVAIENERKQEAEEKRQKQRYYDLEDIPSYFSSDCCCANCYYLNCICDEYRCDLHDFKLVNRGSSAFNFLIRKSCKDFFHK